MLPEELAAEFKALGLPAFRGGQVFSWLSRGARTFDEMTDLSKDLRRTLSERYTIPSLTVLRKQESAQDGTVKFLWALPDGESVETVLMRYKHGNSVCISSQVGCRMGCAFCASTIGGLTRNLTAGEMLGQIYGIERMTGERVSNVVCMGTGEPLDNYDNVVRFIRMLTDRDGHNISERNVTLSTCGIVPGILRLKEEDLMINLALSLHAPDDALRKQIMPIAKRYSLDEIFDALREYYSRNRRRLTFEYSLIAGVNDSDECVTKLVQRVRGMNCLINLIPVNPVRENNFVAPSGEASLAFQKKLEKYGINVTIRREMGRDIDGACGQLRKRYMETDNI